MGDGDAELIERMRAAYAAFNERDYDKAMEFGIHPDFVMVGGQNTVQGADAFRSWMEPDAFESQTLEVLDAEVNGNKLLAHVRTEVRGAGSGIEMTTDTWGLWTFDDAGLATRVEIFWMDQEADARKAAGLG